MGNLNLQTIMLLAQLEVISLLVNNYQPIIYRILRPSSLRFSAELKFPVVKDDLVHFEDRIRLKDEAAPPPHCKIYPLD